VVVSVTDGTGTSRTRPAGCRESAASAAIRRRPSWHCACGRAWRRRRCEGDGRAGHRSAVDLDAAGSPTRRQSWRRDRGRVGAVGPPITPGRVSSTWSDWCDRAGCCRCCKRAAGLGRGERFPPGRDGWRRGRSAVAGSRRGGTGRRRRRSGRGRASAGLPWRRWLVLAIASPASTRSTASSSNGPYRGPLTSWSLLRSLLFRGAVKRLDTP
jgi:hypothetical protein